jgi:uracil-DNA glycosylase
MLLDVQASVHPSWLPVFEGLSAEIAHVSDFLELEAAAGHQWLPESSQILRAFSQPLDQVKVVILGQDPYPTPGHSVGLAFCVAPEVALPRSLVNIFRELQSDLGVDAPASGDLTPWAKQGVLFLNSVLTVGSGASGSHRGKGWEPITSAVIEALINRSEGSPVAILWGKDAQTYGSDFDSRFVISSPHPSPLSARRGFFGSKPFSRTNELLRQQGLTPIEWDLA